MTCIIGLLDKDFCYIGGDTFASNSYTGYNCNRSKVFKVDDFIIGGTTSFRMLDLLEFSFKPRKPYPDEDMNKYMRTDFISEVRSCLAKGGFKEVNNFVESGGTFLVGYKNFLWNVQDDFSIINRFPYGSVGCGHEVAEGSLFTSAKFNALPEDMINMALDAASNYMVGVKGPYTILNTKGEKSDNI